MLKLKCKVGDLAIVTKCGVPERIGLFVRVIELHRDPAFDWSVEILGAPAKGRDLQTGKVGAFRRAAVLDWNLTPIRGNHSDEEIDTKEPTQQDDSEFRRFLNDLQSLTEKEGA